ncbi:MAG: hypothetical protein AUH92_00580 [Acidobacteria bacterium 13_1_40CM_4_69_4]|nr:MAG: hypothetical protein AUH92_00580 [Acidobacteria bacterium 13_1_40CM_4_69_4]
MLLLASTRRAIVIGALAEVKWLRVCGTPSFQDLLSLAIAHRGVHVDQADLLVLSDVQRARDERRLALAAERVDRHGPQRHLHEAGAGIPGHGERRALESAEERAVGIDLDARDAGVLGRRGLDRDACWSEDEPRRGRLQEAYRDRTGLTRRRLRDTGCRQEGRDQYDRAK